MSDVFTKLSAPFKPSEVDWRVGSTTKDKSKGMALAYLDARAVMMRLDDVCGPAGWQNRYTVGEGKTICEIGIKCGDEWIWKADGAGNSDIEAEKGALSDAFKRAAVRWGVGRYLYDMGSPWVALEAKGSTHVIAESERHKLNALLSRGVPQEPAPPPASRPQIVPAAQPQPAPQKTVGTWTDDAITTVKTFKSGKALDAWLVENEADIEKVTKLSPKNADRLQDAINVQMDSFNTLRAG